MYRKMIDRTRSDQMFRAFRKFHLKNPRVWSIFRDAADRHARRGRTNYSAQLIIEEIRWHESMDGLKINNNFVAFYARMYHLLNPGQPHLFRLRYRPSVDTAPFLEVIDRPAVMDPVVAEERRLDKALSTLPNRL